MDWYALNINPEPWAIGEAGIGRRGGKLTAFISPNRQLKEFKQAVREELEARPHKTYQGPVRVCLYFWRQTAKYQTANGTATRNRPDATNMQKAVEDAVQGVLFPNDREVVHIESMIVQSGPDVDGRILIGVEPDNKIPQAFVDMPPAARLELARAAKEQDKRIQADDLEWGTDEASPF